MGFYGKHEDIPFQEEEKGRKVNKRVKLPEHAKKKYERMNLKETVWHDSFCHQMTLLLVVEGWSSTFLLGESAETKPGTMGLSVVPREF